MFRSTAARACVLALMLAGGLPMLSARALPQPAGAAAPASPVGSVTRPASPAGLRTKVRRTAAPRGLTTHLLRPSAAGAAGSGGVIHWGNNDYGQAAITSPIRNVMAVSAGESHLLALRVDGTVAAAGRNDFGQCNVPADLSGVIQVAAGNRNNLALKSDGTVVAWGTGASAQTEVPDSLTGVIDIATSATHCLALKDDGTVVAWGNNRDGSLDVPAGLNNVIAISAGAWYSLALKADGTVVGWGNNAHGQATPPAGLQGVMAIATGDFHGLALKTDGTVVSWGNNSYGQATAPADLQGVTAIAAGDLFSVARRADGTVVAWGRNESGQVNVPAGLDYVSAIAARGSHCIALRAASRVRAWGYAPFATSGLVTNAVRLSAGAGHALALRSNGTAVGWGDPSFSMGALNVPAGLGALRDLEAGAYFSLYLKSDGTVTGVGYSSSGCCFTPLVMPVGLSGLRAVSGGINQAFALRADGTVFGWGRGSEGQLAFPADLSNVKGVGGGNWHSAALKADGTVVMCGTQNTGVPADLTGVKELSFGAVHTLALKSDGTVVAWGTNHAGQTSVPEGLHGVRAISAGLLHSMALKDDGTVVIWGSNQAGERIVPTGVSGVSYVAGGQNHSSAIVADQAPTLTAPSLVEMGEDTSSAFNFTVGDHETVATSLATAASCSVPALLQDLTVTGSGATRTVSLVPVENQFGTAILTLTVSDGISQTSKQIPLTVQPRNDPPSYLKGADQTVDEDAGPQSVPAWATGISTGPVNESSQQLTFHLVTNTHPELFSMAPAVDPITGDLTYTPASNAFGTATVGFQLQDDGGTLNGGQDTDPSPVQTFQITVNSLPDAPLAAGESYALWKNTSRVIAAPGVLGNDLELDGEALGAVLASGVSHGSLTLNADGSFTYIPTAGYAGPDSFTYQARDAGGALSSPVTVTLTVQNDTTKPTAVVGTVVSLTGPTRVYVPVTLSDSQSGVAAVQLTTNSTNVVLVDPATGRQVPVGGTLPFDPALPSLVVRATKIDPTRSARVELRVTDASGNVLLADPVVANLEVKKRQIDRTYKNLPRHEHYLAVENGTPGLTFVKLWVNGKRVHAGALADGAVLRLDVAPWMTKAKSTVRIQAEGPAGATAVLLIGDQSLAGGGTAPPAARASAVRREQLRLVP